MFLVVNTRGQSCMPSGVDAGVPVHLYCFSNLDETMSYLYGCLRSDRVRSAAFQAIGLIAVSVGDSITRHLARIMDVIRASLPSKDLPVK